MIHARTRVKFCGITQVSEIRAAVALGVDALGFIFAPSPRRLTLRDAASLFAHIPPFVTPIGVFVDPSDELYASVRELLPRMVPQFCGAESPQRCRELARGAYLKVVHVANDTQPAKLCDALDVYKEGLIVFDTQSAGQAGGSGQVFDWSYLPPAPLLGVVAGGLTPDNVAACIRQTRPFAVDVRSGVESEGQKDVIKMAAFLDAVRAADADFFAMGTGA